MAEKDLILREKLKDYGLFNFRDFYEYAAEWLKNESYFKH